MLVTEIPPATEDIHRKLPPRENPPERSPALPVRESRGSDRVKSIGQCEFSNFRFKIVATFRRGTSGDLRGNHRGRGYCHVVYLLESIVLYTIYREAQKAWLLY